MLADTIKHRLLCQTASDVLLSCIPLSPTPSDACELTLNPDSANRYLSLSEDNRKVTAVLNELSYPDNAERFHHWKQVLCREGLTGGCYWEVDWKGWVNIGVAYKQIQRKGQYDNCWIGQNDKSWSLLCRDKFSNCHKNRKVVIPIQSSSIFGLACWHSSVSSDALVHLHTFSCTFTEPLYPAFGIQLDCNTSVSLSQM